MLQLMFFCCIKSQTILNVLHYTVFKLTPLPDNIQREEDISYKNLDIRRVPFEIFS